MVGAYTHTPAGIAIVVPILDMDMLEPEPTGVSWQLHVHHVTQNSVAFNSEVFAPPQPRPWVIGDPRALLTATDVWVRCARGVSDANDEALLRACEVLEARVASGRATASAPVIAIALAPPPDFGVIHEKV